ncbi:hypothetical protein HPP92_001184 [Vanilla planifolia]|uniref:Uncharacterized protein n=1 Tax=Vanilla planifolia TaxID=51239 RepID=A0A835VF90_VANPL|nr:hypothetical protein HPP92_001333 [Vanilla planifolia]KAG0501112.1 hypothetical protein HPP92_001184 [Vanilla planifolia]
MVMEIPQVRDFQKRSTPDLFPRGGFSPIRHNDNRKPPAMEKRRRRRREGLPRTGEQQKLERRLEMGKVTILKRGETLEGTVEEKVDGSSGVVDGTCEESLQTERLDPDPEVIPRRIRLVPRCEEEYAGSEFSSSPSPRSLPLPSFSKKGIAQVAAFDLSATVGLLRLLRIEE